MDPHKEIRRGNPAEVITEIARREGTDLLILSTHGRTGLNRVHRGSVADRVIRTALCPVLVVGPRVMEPGQWKSNRAVKPITRILVPLDGSPAAEDAVPEAMRFAAALGSDLYLFRAMLMPMLNDSFAGVTSYSDQVCGRTYRIGVGLSGGRSPSSQSASFLSPKKCVSELQVCCSKTRFRPTTLTSLS